MDPLACVDVVALPLQLLIQDHPDWSGRPIAVVEHDKPLAEILWVNEEARAQRILPGMRYAAALSISKTLHAGVVTPERIDKAVADITSYLRDFSPAIEPSQTQPGVFYVNATGLEHLFPSLNKWAHQIASALKQHGFYARVVVGSSQLTTLAIARSLPRQKHVHVFESATIERAAAGKVQLSRLDIPAKAREVLAKLGIVTVRDFIALPGDALRERYGQEVYHLHRMARGEVAAPLSPEAPPQDFDQKLILDYPELDSTRLIFLIKRIMDPLLSQLASQGAALTELTITFKLDRSQELVAHHIRPAQPTLDGRSLLALTHLRLEAAHLPSPVVEIFLSALHVRATPEQLRLFALQPKRDLKAANQALAKIRAEFGNDVVVHARVRDAHLPEAQYTWEPLETVSLPSPQQEKKRPLVRRIFQTPVPLPPRPRHEPDGWILRGLECGPIVKVHGPFLFSGGWWRKLIAREYHFAEAQRGDLLWVYYDRIRRQWFLHGQVE